MNTNKRRVSARRKVLDDCVNSTRELIIHTELDLKYLRGVLEKDGNLMSEEQLAMFKQEERHLETMIKSHIKKLEFYKGEKEELIAKNAMKNYEKYPSKISMDELEEVK
ncbi:MAG: hypothetical protein ACRCX2_05935 [Paraclostridium sp.]